MAGAIHGEEGPLAGINVTPLVDVVLVLLIVLMVTANFLASQSIPLDLPKAVVAADGRNTHARVVKVMDILREEKIVHFAD
ncbi:biopolymer transporter ExbD [Pendulispora rubella]|uniref:Biopolymer transporter ExbD n=1 Tax=Pendulispora rubella TaxID=2741070 RepID=A0ABZ2KYX3_9BACT